MIAVSFASPERLWILVVVAALAGAYVVAARRRPRYVVRFTNLALLDLVAPRPPRWRRHLPAALLLLALAGMAVSLARPRHQVRVARREAVVVVAVDVSPSMMATDVAPSRFEALQRAVARFASDLPDGVSLGLVSFAGTAHVVVPPTREHDLVQGAVERLRFRSQTALAEAIFASLEALASTLEGRTEPPPAGIVLMSDGASTAGRPESEAIRQAVAARVPVSTIAFGTKAGTITLEGGAQPVPVDGTALRSIATETGGVYFEAATGDQLTEIYRHIGRSVATTTEPRELTGWFVAGAFLLTLAAACASLAWFARLP
ncbi:MAG: VWA domain-containing protein [Actinomycetota bacterium]